MSLKSRLEKLEKQMPAERSGLPPNFLRRVLAAINGLSPLDNDVREALEEICPTGWFEEMGFPP